MLNPVLRHHQEGPLQSNPAFHLSFLAGGAAHLLETFTLGHILDRLKTQHETFPELLTVKQSFQSILEKGGWKEFYKGLRWNASLSAIKGAGGWTIHNFYNRKISYFYPSKQSSSFEMALLVACATATTETTAFLCPLERLKVLEMTYDRSKRLQITKLIRSEGIRFIYRGWSLMILQKNWNWISYLGTYQQLREGILRCNNESCMTFNQKIFLGCGTGSIVACLNAPMDLIKTQIQKYGALKSESSLMTALSIVKKYGWQGMYRGLKMKITRNAWSTSVVLLTLDYLNALPENLQV